jgi:glycosyltransferase involved in cell wall biosynthesis
MFVTKVSVLIPAHNESIHIYDTVRAVQQVPEVDEIIVVDDASGDNTAELAEKAGAKVIRLPANLGKGGALNKGMTVVTGNIIALVDGDLGRTAGDVRKLIMPVLEGRVDMTIARFARARKKGGFGLVKGLARNGIRIFTGLEMMSPLSGQRVMTRQVFETLGSFASGYGVEVGLTIDVARRGFRIEEVDVNMTHAETGRDLHGFIHRGKQFVHVLKVLASRAVIR